MKSKLSTDILKKGKDSRFMRTAPATFGLRSWVERIGTEYVAERFVKSKFDETILVFGAEDLSRLVPEPGFYAKKLSRKTLADICFEMKRSDAENTFDVIQLISVFTVFYKGKVLTYKRSKRLPEERLHGAYSASFGGHLTIEDFGMFQTLWDPLEQAGNPEIIRELNEELVLDHEPKISWAGVMYDDSNPMSSQHIGLCYWVDLKNKEYAIGEKGFLVDAKFESLPEINLRLDQFENWSRTILSEFSLLGQPVSRQSELF